MSDKQLSFSIVIDGISNEANELAKITLQLQNLKKEQKELYELAKNGFASKEQISQLAAYNKEIDNQTARQKELKKVMDSAPDSLNRMRQELINLKNQYANTSGEIRDRMAPAINELNNKISTAEQAIGVHQRNVGNYKDALGLLPGPLGTAASAVSNFSSKLAAVGPVGAIIAGGLSKLAAIGPVVAIIAGGLEALSAPVIAFFKWSQEGMDLLSVKTAGWKAQLNVLKGVLVDIGRTAVENGEKSDGWLTKAWDGLKNLTVVGNLVKLTMWEINKLFPDTIKKMNEAGSAGEAYAKAIHGIEQAEIDEIVPRAKATEQIRQARLAYAEQKGTIDEQIKSFDEALKLENETTDQEIANAHKKTIAIKEANYVKAKSIPLTRDEMRMAAEAEAQEIDLQSASDARMQKAAGLRNKLLAEKEAPAKLLAEWKKANTELVEKSKESFDVELYQAQLKHDKKIELESSTLKFSKSAAEANEKIIKKNAQDEEEILKRRASNYADFAMSMGQSLGDFISGQKKGFKEFAKSILLDALDLLQRQLIIAQAETLIKSMANSIWNPIAMIKGLVKIGLEEAAFATAKGVIEGMETGGRVTKGVPIKTGTKDNLLIAVHRDEAVLNPVQIARLGGSGAMRRARVPGFAEGGYVGSELPNIPSNEFDYYKLASLLNDRPIRLELNKLNKAQQELSIITTPQKI
jgi:hypothetical protein